MLRGDGKEIRTVSRSCIKIHFYDGVGGQEAEINGPHGSTCELSLSLSLSYLAAPAQTFLATKQSHFMQFEGERRISRGAAVSPSVSEAR